VTATIHGTELDRYVADVADHLGAVPESERAELLDDLRDHLAEVAAEDDGSLVARLGPPAAYAADLLASAGLVPDGIGPGLLERASALWDALRHSAPVRETVRFLPELRPAWWIVRAVAVVFAVNVLLVTDYERVWPWPEAGPVNRGFVLVPLVLAIAASVAVGRRTVAGHGRGAMAVVNVVILGLAWLAFVDMHSAGVDRPTTIVDTRPGFNTQGGQPVTNIYPYDATGQPLHGLRLFDQDGQPIDVRDQATSEGLVPVDTIGYPYDLRQPDGTPVPPPVVTAGG
jgi:hypothetical protein